MGFTRKIMSVSTIGLVDYRSDKERIARKTAKGARAAKKQNRLIEVQNKLLEKQTAAQERLAEQTVTQAAPPSPAGWYPDYQNPAYQRYFDGSGWTDQIRPVGPPAP